MNAFSPTVVLAASLSGAALSLLAVWNRARRPDPWHLRSVTVLLVGSGAFLAAVIAFTRVLSSFGFLFGATITLLVSAWAAVLNTVVPLPVPIFFRAATGPERRFFRHRWTGLPLFRAVLARTPLGRLAGPIYLHRSRHNFTVVLHSIHQAQAVHLWSFFLTVPWLVSWSVNSHWFMLAGSLAVHLFANVYPILHLRLARARLELCLPRLAGKSGFHCVVSRSEDVRNSQPDPYNLGQ